MPSSSTDSAALRLEWRPSGIAACCCLLLPVLGLGAWRLSALSMGMPGWLGLLLWPAALCLGFVMARRYLRRPRCELWLLADQRLRWEEPGRGWCEAAARYDERGPIRVLRVVAHGPAWVFWPDTLAVAGLRALRLWSRRAPSPAPHIWMS